MDTTLKHPKRRAPDALVAAGSSLAKKLTTLGQPIQPNILTSALHEILDGQDEMTKALRLAIQIHLARVSNGSGSVKDAKGDNEEMLGTEAAAQLMNCSRPYVAMLIDAEKLAGGVKSPGGHRKVPKSSVLQWIAATKAKPVGDKNYRKAAADAGMYLVADELYVKVTRGSRRDA